MKTKLRSVQATVSRPPQSRREHGSAILGVVGLMVVVSVLGVALLTFLADSSESTLVTDSGNQAFFMAESGARYAIARVLQGGETAAADMTGRRFTLTGGRAFDLVIEVQHLTGLTRYCIDATGVSNAGVAIERQAINGYVIDVPTGPTLELPVDLTYAALLTGNQTLSLSGSSYIDSYDSTAPATVWTSPGQYNDATVAINLRTDAASLTSQTAIYGDLQVATGADLNHLTTIVNRPGSILGDQGIVTAPAVSAAAVPPPTEAAEVPPPTSLTNMPSFNTYGTQTVRGGNYTIGGDLSPGSARLTLSSPTYVSTGDDIDIGSGGSITVVGSFAARVSDNMNVKGNSVGLSIQGNGDLWVSDALNISSGSGMSVTGTLDLDVGGSVDISGGSHVVLGGNSDIDIAGSFDLQGGASLHIDGKVVLRVGTGFHVSGDAAITFGPNASLEVYVGVGKVDLASVDISAGGIASRFLIICAPAVTEVEVKGDATVYAGIYAPGAEIKITGSSELFGAVVAKTLELNGTAALHYDTGLQVVPPQDLTILRRFWIAAGN